MDNTIENGKEETRVCTRCNKELPILSFQSYWYQPLRGGKAYGERVRRRIKTCYDCKETFKTVPKVKYFTEKSTKEMNSNDKEWDSVDSRMIFLQEELEDAIFLNDVKKLGDTHDIVGIRFPSTKFLLQSKVLKKMMEGKTIGTKKWLPSEIWIYCPINESD